MTEIQDNVFACVYMYSVANPCDSLIVYVSTQVSAFCAFVASSVAQSEYSSVGAFSTLRSLMSRSQAAAC